MAKEKKSASKARTPPHPKSASPKTTPSGPFVDPGRSAAAAAAMVGSKMSATGTNAGAAQTGSHIESSMFRQLKDALNKPHAQMIDGMLDKISSTNPKKSSQPIAGGKQVGHNQMVGSEASRRSVPRRTGG